MGLLEEILECKDEEVDSIMENAIKEANENAEKTEYIGFSAGKQNLLFKGFIPLDTRIKYETNSISNYGMQTTDYMYEFAHYIRDNNLKTKADIIDNLEPFMNDYFGMPKKNADRSDILQEKAMQTKTDEEYWEAIENSEIGDLRNRGAALCTEKTAMAQELLSLFGFESYYCMGCVNLGNKQEPHAFNLIKGKSDRYAIVDYTCPVEGFDEKWKFEDYHPFVCFLKKESTSDFLNNRLCIRANEYIYHGKEKEENGKERYYVARQFEISKNNTKSNPNPKEDPDEER